MERNPEEVFAILVKDHELGLLAFVSAHVPEPAAAADVVQEVFLGAWRQLEQFDHAHSFSAYLRGIARHKIADHYRNVLTNRRELDSLRAEQLAKIGAEFDRQVPDDTELFEARLAALRACIAKLNGPARDVIEQHYRLGRPCSEVATTLGRTVEAVKKLLQRARITLHDCIQSRFRGEASHVG